MLLLRTVLAPQTHLLLCCCYVLLDHRHTHTHAHTHTHTRTLTHTHSHTRTPSVTLYENDTVANLVRYLAGWTLAIGAGEFLLNPTVGKLSDAIGRKPFMLLSPIMNIVMKTMVALNPSIWTLSLEKVFCDGLRTMSGTAISTARSRSPPATPDPRPRKNKTPTEISAQF